MRIEAVFVGTELLEHRVNTHVRDVAARLAEVGLGLARATTVADEEAEIETAVRESLSRADATIVVGGLGPTFDDLTREGVARAVGRRLVFDPKLMREIRRRFASRKLPMPPENERQAYVIEGARSLDNPTGSAPGQSLAFDGGRKIFLLPGPYHEMAPMLEADVIRALRGGAKKGALSARASMQLGGIMESVADHRLRPVLSRHPQVRCTILSGKGLVSLHAAAPTRAALSRFLGAVRRKLGAHIFDERGLELAGAVGERLRARRQTLAVAESCTGGMLAAKLTEAPGSSGYFVGGLVAYSNALKTRELGVSGALLKKEGAVSAQVAEAMARGARERYGADWAISVTGVAGPGGGSKDKPVGRVFLGLAGAKGATSESFLYTGDRAEVRHKSANAALYRLWRALTPNAK